MSSLTSETKVIWKAVLYNARDEIELFGMDMPTQEEAIDDGERMVRFYVDHENDYYYAKVECHVLPVYK